MDFIFSGSHSNNELWFDLHSIILCWALCRRRQTSQEATEIVQVRDNKCLTLSLPGKVVITIYCLGPWPLNSFVSFTYFYLLIYLIYNNLENKVIIKNNYMTSWSEFKHSKTRVTIQNKQYPLNATNCSLIDCHAWAWNMSIL